MMENKVHNINITSDHVRNGLSSIVVQLVKVIQVEQGCTEAEAKTLARKTLMHEFMRLMDVNTLESIKDTRMKVLKAMTSKSPGNSRDTYTILKGLELL